MSDKFELGYTPKNLRIIIDHLNLRNLNNQQIAEKIGASSYSTLRNWASDADQPRHRNMPVEKWQKVLELYYSNT